MDIDDESGKSKRRRGAAKRANMNWTAAKLLFAEGRLSIRAIGRRCAIPENTLRRNARAEGWRRGPGQDLSEAPPLPATAPQEAGRSGAEGPPPDPDAIPSAIADKGRDLLARMLAELEAITSHRGELRALIIDATREDGDGRRRARLLRMVDLPTRATVLKDLAAAARTLGEARPAVAAGKKVEAKDKAARVAATGRFATPPVPPKLIVNNEPGRR